MKFSWGARFLAWKKDIKEHQKKIALSLILATIALIFNLLSGFYVERIGTAEPRDLILNYLPALDLSFVYVWFFMAIILVFIAYPLIYHPKKFHYILGMYSLFIVIKAGFVVLTHLSAPLGAIPLTWTPFFYDWFSFPNSQFFAGQVGLPFLGYLVYFKHKFLRRFMLFSSILLAIVSLLMHQHYSIDVLSAFFITYGIYKVGDYVFND